MRTEGLAGDPEFSSAIQDQVERLSRKSWYHSIELPDGAVLPGMVSLEDLEQRLAAFPIPKNLAGMRVLDVGAWTGWCSFALERRGAVVTAVDCIEFEEFRLAHKSLGSRVDYRILDVDELSPDAVGLFDYVLCLGVVYHLRHPLLGLEKICSVTADTAFIESYVTSADACSLEFYETDELGGQIDNWYGPSVNGLLALCRSAGFARVALEYSKGGRAGVTCRRRWDPPSADPSAAAPWINCAVNNRTQDIYFHKTKDEYVCLYFKCSEPSLTKDQLRAEVDGFGAPVLVLADLGRGGWQANFRVPPGLAIGSHEVRLRTIGSPLSNSFEIVMRSAPEQPARVRPQLVPLDQAAEPAPQVYELEGSITENAILRGYRNECLCCRFRSAAASLSRDEVILDIDGVEQPVSFLTNLGKGAWQLNAGLPKLSAGAHYARVRTVNSKFSDAVKFLFEPE